MADASETNTTLAPKETFGTRLKRTLTENALIVIIGIFVSGVGSAVAVYEKVMPWRQNSDYQKLEKDYQQVLGSLDKATGPATIWIDPPDYGSSHRRFELLFWGR